jgi:hypothetical protein
MHVQQHEAADQGALGDAAEVREAGGVIPQRSG